jgi:hypothetical protein
MTVPSSVTYYKVWVEIEKIDEATDTYEDCELPQGLREFRTEEEAIAFCTRLSDTYWDGGID